MVMYPAQSTRSRRVPRLRARSTPSFRWGARCRSWPISPVNMATSRSPRARSAAIVERIGPEVCRLPWAQGLQSARKHQSKRMRSAPTEPDTLLSPREREVAALLAAGLTDRQIAEQLVITQGTAGVHVGHILTKLGFHTRTQIA